MLIDENAVNADSEPVACQHVVACGVRGGTSTLGQPTYLRMRSGFVAFMGRAGVPALSRRIGTSAADVSESGPKHWSYADAAVVPWPNGASRRQASVEAASKHPPLLLGSAGPEGVGASLGGFTAGLCGEALGAEGAAAVGLAGGAVAVGLVTGFRAGVCGRLRCGFGDGGEDGYQAL